MLACDIILKSMAEQLTMINYFDPLPMMSSPGSIASCPFLQHLHYGLQVKDRNQDYVNWNRCLVNIHNGLQSKDNVNWIRCLD